MRKRSLALATFVATVLVLTTSPASAGSVYRIKDAPSPTTGQLLDGGGSWIVNKGNGYYLGRAYKGSEFDVHKSTTNHWHYGRAISTVNMCGWVVPGSMDYKIGTRADSCSDATQEFLRHRLNIGKDFNAPAYAADNYNTTTANNCPFYFNYFYGTNFPNNGGYWNGYAGHFSGTVQYRFTTRDGGARVIRILSTPGPGWGFMPSWCAGTSWPLYNDND